MKIIMMTGSAHKNGTSAYLAEHFMRGAKEAVWMVRNAEKVSSICNDVVGDICGIISGATGALIVAHITAGTSGLMKVLVSLLITDNKTTVCTKAFVTEA